MPTGNRVEDLIRAEFVPQEEDELLEELREKMYNASSYEEARDIQSQILALRHKQTDRYIAARGTEEAILEDAAKVITAVSLEEWKNYLKGCLDHYNEELAARNNEHNEHNEQYREAKPADVEFMENLFEYTKDNIENFLVYLILHRLDFQVDALVKFTTPRKSLQFMLLPLAEKRYKELSGKAECGIAPRNHSLFSRILPNNLNLPLDKFNCVGSGFWNVLADSDSGQLTLGLGLKGQKSLVPEENLAVIGAIIWDDDIKTTKRLTEFDKRLTAALGTLYNHGCYEVTFSQIHKIMGNATEPNQRQKELINDSLSKMGVARLYLDNKGEIEAGYSYPAFRYDKPLLIFERLQIEYRGQESIAIRLSEEPPLIKFARERDQITSIPLKVLQAPLNKTIENMKIEDYLLERISHMKNDEKKAIRASRNSKPHRTVEQCRSLSRKIKLNTIFTACEIKGKQAQRAPEKIKKFLNWYISTGFIVKYEIDEYKDIIITV